MPEVLFSCGCGMMLKVYGEDQAGAEITCPSCHETVVVPTISAAKITPPPSADAAAAGGHGMAFAIVYLSAIGLVTAGLVKYLLLPALERPAIVAQLEPVEPPKPEPKVAKPEPPRRVDPVEDLAAKRAVAAAAQEEARKAAERVTLEKKAATKKARAREPAKKKAAAPPYRFPIPTGPDPTLAPSPSPSPADPKPASKGPESSPYAKVANTEARTNLEDALRMLDRRDPRMLPTVELFLKSAERAGAGDATVRMEVKKLRDRMAGMRKTR